ncbi:hypothetical protein [Nonomuraea jabiensis]|uniref:Uncharacterized protein n=1 Tax=Nonomuraea jabiensis TaxID=882448 RepID=A0A7W9FZF6_9ACTN|nr:hypothetical protein [Nonomuraea jabiensis]MBB5774409.1 hypothetical protein [Nonomuraea jabiensis]
MKATNQSTFAIADRGLLITRYGPPRVLDGVAERRSAVMRTLEILSPVVRPLALEISFGPLDPETFAVSPETETRRLATPAIPAGVANQSAYAEPAEIELVDELTADVVARALTPPYPDWDVGTIRATVTAARVSATDLTIEQLPSRHVPVVVLDGERWAVGPIDALGYRLQPPVALVWRQEYGDILLRIEAFWTLWWQTDSAEYVSLRAAEQALDAAGFSPTPG